MTAMTDTKPVVSTPAALPPAACEWRTYVLDRGAWTDTKWEAAQDQGLAIRRTARDLGGHFWTLTDAGLDLFIAGKEIASPSVAACGK